MVRNSSQRDVAINGRTEKLKIAACCLNSRMGRPSENLKQLQTVCHVAAGNGVQIIVFPECWLTGSLSNSECPEDQNGALKLSSPVIQQLVQIAADLKLTILCGLVLANPPHKPFNSSVIINSEGLLGTYHKNVLPNKLEKSFFKAGVKKPAFNAAGVRFSAAICADIDYETTFETAARQGSQIVFAMVGGSGGPKRLHNAKHHRKRAEFHLNLWRRYLLENARKYKLWIVAVDQFGRSGNNWYASLAIVVSPDGDIVAQQIGEEGVLVYELTLDK
jgi:predicted amidohydrolase